MGRNVIVKTPSLNILETPIFRTCVLRLVLIVECIPFSRLNTCHPTVLVNVNIFCSVIAQADKLLQILDMPTLLRIISMALRALDCLNILGSDDVNTLVSNRYNLIHSIIST